MASRRGGPSYAGVQWADVSETMETFLQQQHVRDVSVALYPNGLGVFTLQITINIEVEGKKYACRTEEPWSEAKGRLQAFVYRSLIDTGNACDREIYRMLHGYEAGT